MASLLRISPIVERELRVASRRPATYWSRVGTGALGVTVLLWLLSMDGTVAGASVTGLLGFRILATIASAVLVLGSLHLSSSSLAREKREDTLGLLFLTPLTPMELILGKLTSACLGSLYRFLALVPLLALPMLSGGVSLANFLWLIIGLLHLVFLAATLGLFLSSKSWDEHRALTSTTVYFLGLLVVAPSLANLAASTFHIERPEYLFALSPAFTAYQALFPGWGDGKAMLFSLAWTQAVGWFFLYRTHQRLPRCWQHRPDPVPRTRLDSALVDASRDRPPAEQSIGNRVRSFRLTRSVHRQQVLDGNPIAWLAGRTRAPSVRAWTIGAIAFVGCLYAVDDSFEALLSPRLALFVFFCVNAALKCHVQAQTSYAFARDQAEDRLSLLLYTHISPDQLVRGHLEALQRLRPLVFKLLAFEVIWLTATHAWAVAEQPSYRIQQVIRPAVVVLLVLIPDLYASAWTGLRQSALRNSAVDASRETFNDVMLTPWVLVALVWMGSVITSGWRFLTSLSFLAGPYLVATLAMDAWLIYRARRDLPLLIPLATARRAEDLSVSEERWRILGRRLGLWWARRR
ncbi:MAG: hypothetical protein JNN07_16045 [Verrucomicrobiales bacterium]|nr:hypothetical protein [Verrucomicrobiales bacterium]